MSYILRALAFESRTDHLWSTPAITMAEDLSNLTTLDGPLMWSPHMGVVLTILRLLTKALEELTAENPNTVRTHYLEPFERALRESGAIPFASGKDRVERALREYLWLTAKISICTFYSSREFDEGDHMTAIFFQKTLRKLHEIDEGTRYDRIMRRSHRNIDLHD